jgi:DNA invertase Pin-like site-specific DNA recombinase
MSRLRKGDGLVVWKLDRLGRSLEDLIKEVEILVEFERDLIRERTKADFRAARERGKTGGRSPALGEGDIELAQRLIQDPDGSRRK